MSRRYRTRPRETADHADERRYPFRLGSHRVFIGEFMPLIHPFKRTEERQNRRASSAPAGEKRCDDERSRSEFASFSLATGDRPIVCCSAVKKRDHLSGSAFASLFGRVRLRRSTAMPGQVGGWPSCLCVFVVVTWTDGRFCDAAFSSLCSLCLCGSPDGWVGFAFFAFQILVGEGSIPNSEF